MGAQIGPSVRVWDPWMGECVAKPEHLFDCLEARPHAWMDGPHGWVVAWLGPWLGHGLTGGWPIHFERPAIRRWSDQWRRWPNMVERPASRSTTQACIAKHVVPYLTERLFEDHCGHALQAFSFGPLASLDSRRASAIRGARNPSLRDGDWRRSVRVRFSRESPGRCSAGGRAKGGRGERARLAKGLPGGVLAPRPGLRGRDPTCLSRAENSA